MAEETGNAVNLDLDAIKARCEAATEGPWITAQAAIIAQALAVGAGYTGWPSENEDFVEKPFGSPVHMISSLAFDDGTHVDFTAKEPNLDDDRDD